MEILKLKKNVFHGREIPIILNDVDVEKVLLSNKICFGGKNCKYLIGYFYDNHKVKPLHIMLPTSSTYVKSHDGQTK